MLVSSRQHGPGKLGYKKSFDESHWINRLVEEALRKIL